MRNIKKLTLPYAVIPNRKGIPSDSLGMPLALCQAEGAVPLWNKSNPTQPIAAGDRVLSINGTSGDPKVS